MFLPSLLCGIRHARWNRTSRTGRTSRWSRTNRYVSKIIMICQKPDYLNTENDFHFCLILQDHPEQMEHPAARYVKQFSIFPYRQSLSMTIDEMAFQLENNCDGQAMPKSFVHRRIAVHRSWFHSINSDNNLIHKCSKHSIKMVEHIIFVTFYDAHPERLSLFPLSSHARRRMPISSIMHYMRRAGGLTSYALPLIHIALRKASISNKTCNKCVFISPSRWSFHPWPRVDVPFIELHKETSFLHHKIPQ